MTWRKVEYRSAHPRLVDEETFERVQQVLDAHNGSGERPRQHQHYLKSTVWCGRCGARLG